MSKKSHWKLISSTESYKVMSEEERAKAREKKKEDRKKELKTVLMLNRMATKKIGFKKKEGKRDAATA